MFRGLGLKALRFRTQGLRLRGLELRVLGFMALGLRASRFNQPTRMPRTTPPLFHWGGGRGYFDIKGNDYRVFCMVLAGRTGICTTVQCMAFTGSIHIDPGNKNCPGSGD